LEIGWAQDSVQPSDGPRQLQIAEKRDISKMPGAIKRTQTAQIRNIVLGLREKECEKSQRGPMRKAKPPPARRRDMGEENSADGRQKGVRFIRERMEGEQQVQCRARGTDQCAKGKLRPPAKRKKVDQSSQYSTKSKGIRESEIEKRPTNPERRTREGRSVPRLFEH